MESEVKEAIRNKMRQNTNAERAERRDEMFIKHRGLSVDDLKIKKINEDDVIAAALAITNNQCNKINNLKFLKQSFINNTDFIKTFMTIEGASHALIKLVLSSNSAIQLLALECCCNLSLGEYKTCVKLTKGAGVYLINMLQGLNYNLMYVAILTLGNLCANGKKCSTILFNQGLVKSLERTIQIAELREPTVKTMIHFTKYCLKDLSKDECKAIVKSCLLYYESSVCIQWLIYHFSSLPDVQTILILYQYPNIILNYLLRFCFSNESNIVQKNIVSITAKIRTLSFLCTDCKGTTISYLLDNWIDTFCVLKFLLRREWFIYLNEEVHWLIGNIIRHDNTVIKTRIVALQRDIYYLFSRCPFPKHEFSQ